MEDAIGQENELGWLGFLKRVEVPEMSRVVRKSWPLLLHLGKSGTRVTWLARKGSQKLTGTL